jgi:hypothetical protein
MLERMDAPAFDCALCGDRTVGPTRELALGYGVHVWVCDEHGSPDFQRLHRGRPFAEMLERVWAANGCLTQGRRRALDPHLRALAPGEARPRPGSYTWATLRREAERRFATGEPPRQVVDELRDVVEGYGANPPSVRSMMRWYAERRWLTSPGRGAERAWLATPSTGGEAP